MRCLPRLPIRALTAAALVVVGFAFAPGRAEASCGDYVYVQTANQTPEIAPIQPQPPCHGPGCSKAPAAPPVPLTAPVSSSSETDQSPVVLDADSDDRPGSGWAAGHRAAAQPIRLTSSIFHPPRAV
jgi:hypothetical protein